MRIQALLPIACVAALVPSFQDPAGRQQLHVLTPEQREILSHMSIVYLNDGQGGTAKTIRIEGVNLQVVNGLGATNGYPTDPRSVDGADTATNGVGNLIVGYNEFGNPNGNNRTGSHNLVIGQGLNHATFGGVLVGRDNGIGGAYASIVGGVGNRGLGDFATVAGGRNGTASGLESSVHGGVGGTASGLQASVHGGSVCTASGDNATTSGGNLNMATGVRSSVSGGERNEASGSGSSVSGGEDNEASGNFSSVAGGDTNDAMGNHSAVAGGQTNVASGFWSAVSGGQGNTAGPPNQSYVTVGGGMSRATVDSHDWAAGSLLEDD